MHIEDLANEISNRRLILFIGSGVSQILGLPSWEKLVDHIADELGYLPRLFKQMADFYTLAEFYIIKKGHIGPLRSWMDTNWHSTPVKIEDSKIHELIVKLDCPIIYTTNYDRWLERAYDYYAPKKTYTKITGVQNIPQIQEHTTQIVKFHGDFDDDKSMILTESSYFERLDFSRPLDIKLKYDLLGKSVLFIGYSFSDINVRFLLYQIHKMWDVIDLTEAHPKSYIFLSKPNLVVEQVLKQRGISAIVNTRDDPEEGLESFLQSLINALSK